MTNSVFLERDGMFFTSTQAAEYDEKKKLTPEFVPMGIIVSDEANGIQWLKNQLQSGAKTYQEIQPEWMQAINGTRKNDIIPELKQLLEENFIEEDGGKWHLPNIQKFYEFKGRYVITKQQVAEYYGVNIKTITRYIDAHKDEYVLYTYGQTR